MNFLNFYIMKEFQKNCYKIVILLAKKRLMCYNYTG